MVAKTAYETNNLAPSFIIKRLKSSDYFRPLLGCQDAEDCILCGAFTAGSMAKTTPDATAGYAATDGIGFGNQGLEQSDLINSPGKPCTGEGWGARSQKYAGENPPLPLELQSLSPPRDQQLRAAWLPERLAPST